MAPRQKEELKFIHGQIACCLTRHASRTMYLIDHRALSWLETRFAAESPAGEVIHRNTSRNNSRVQIVQKQNIKNTSEEGGATSQHTVNSSTASNCISLLETHVILYVNMLVACYLSLSSLSHLAQLSDNFRRTASFHRPFQRHTSCFGPFPIIDQCFCCLCHCSVRVDRPLQTVLRFSCERRVHSEFVRFTPSPMPDELADESLHLTGVQAILLPGFFNGLFIAFREHFNDLKTLILARCPTLFSYCACFQTSVQ